MRARRWSAFWTILAAIAGVVGAAAAVYPLVGNQQKLVHLTFDEHAEMLRLSALSEPIILTGNWSIKKRARGWWWDTPVIDSTTTPSFMLTDIKDRQLLEGERKWIAFWEPDIKTAAQCPLNEGDLVISIEFKSVRGTALATAALPYCAEAAP